MSLPPPPASPVTRDPRQSSLSTWQKVAFGAAAAVAVGAFLDWAVLQTFLGSVSVAGIEGDGKLTVALAIAAGILLARRPKGASLAAAIVFALILAIGVYDFNNIQSKIDDVNTSVARASIGIGLYLTIIGGIGGVIASLIRRGELAAQSQSVDSTH